MTVDEEQLRRVAEQVQEDLDPDDPDGFSRALDRAAHLRLEPNEAQRAVLAQLQTIVGLTGAWVRHEARTAVAGRLPSLGRIEEVLRRRRATRGDGEELLAGLLGLDLQPRTRDRGALRRDGARRARERRTATSPRSPGEPAGRPSSPSRDRGSRVRPMTSTSPTMSRRCWKASATRRVRAARRSARTRHQAGRAA
jgi:hypothetical protein